MGTSGFVDAGVGFSTTQVETSFGKISSPVDPGVTRFHCTGFGPFHGVSANPTEMIMRQLHCYFKEHGLPPRVDISSASVLEVSALSTRTLLERMHSKVEENVVSCSPKSIGSSPRGHLAPRTVFLHFGVDAGAERFALELQGRNEATFSCPDESGWSPIMRQIDPDVRIPLTHVRQTRLPVQRLASELRCEGFNVGVSSDAGRFVCNWVYYNSLRLAERNGSLALFVHVPRPSVVPIEIQMKFVSALVARIASLGDNYDAQ